MKHIMGVYEHFLKIRNLGNKNLIGVMCASNILLSVCRIENFLPVICDVDIGANPSPELVMTMRVSMTRP